MNIFKWAEDQGGFTFFCLVISVFLVMIPLASLLSFSFFLLAKYYPLGIAGLFLLAPAYLVGAYLLRDKGEE